MEINQCPMCGSTVAPRARTCEYCDTVLINVGLSVGAGSNKVADESFQKWRTILQNDPNNADANYALGLLYLNRKLHEEAVTHLRKAAKLAPENVMAHFNLSLALFNDGDINLESAEFGEMANEINRCIKIEPNFSEAKAFLHLFEALKITDHSVKFKHYQAAIEMCPDIPIFYHELVFCVAAMGKEFPVGEKALNTLISLSPEFKHTPALACYFYNQWMLQFNKATATQPKEAVQSIDVGRRAKKIIDSLDKLLIENESKEQMADFYYNYGMCLLFFGRQSDAIKELKEAVSLMPDNTQYVNMLKMAKRPLMFFIGSSVFVVIGIFMLLSPSSTGSDVIKALLCIVFFGFCSIKYGKIALANKKV